jgi:hypothetical protein
MNSGSFARRFCHALGAVKGALRGARANEMSAAAQPQTLDGAVLRRGALRLANDKGRVSIAIERKRYIVLARDGL